MTAHTATEDRLDANADPLLTPLGRDIIARVHTALRLMPVGPAADGHDERLRAELTTVAARVSFSSMSVAEMTALMAILAIDDARH